MKYILYTLFITQILLIRFNGSAQHPPHIFLRSSPASGTYEEPLSISFYATAYDQDGTIERVEYYLCGTKLTSTKEEPYDLILKDLTAGTYCITAKAMDNDDSSTLSYAINFTVIPASPACESLPAYTENAGYVAGSKVSNKGHLYECKPWPYSGWCNGAWWAYEPGSGAYWTDAWTDLGICSEETWNCESLETYHEGGSYGPGSQVSLNGMRYECRPWPNSGWCSGAAWAYAPGSGTYWQDAWTALGDCPFSSRTMNLQNKEVLAHPHPFEETTTVQLENQEEIISMELYNSQGILMFSDPDLHQKELLLGSNWASGYYILHLTTKNRTYSKTLIKR